MTIDAEILAIICCPDTHQDLTLINSNQLTLLNSLRSESQLRHRNGNLVNYDLSGGLIRNDQEVIYPIREGIPVLLSEEAIPIDKTLKEELFKGL